MSIKVCFVLNGASFADMSIWLCFVSKQEMKHTHQCEHMVLLIILLVILKNFLPGAMLNLLIVTQFSALCRHANGDFKVQEKC
jgi:hypothetical protein